MIFGHALVPLRPCFFADASYTRLGGAALECGCRPCRTEMALNSSAPAADFDDLWRRCRPQTEFSCILFWKKFQKGTDKD